MGSTRYVALLRGINVGGKNKISMSELRAWIEAHGCTNVGTYIQSGNVVFESDTARASLETGIETMLEKRFGAPLVVVVRSHRQLQNVVASAPKGFGTKPDTYHSDAIFLKEPLTSAQAMNVVRVREGVDEAAAGPAVLYFSRLSAQRTKSRMSSIVGTSEYRQMTIRSWTTTTKLLGLLDALRDG